MMYKYSDGTLYYADNRYIPRYKWVL